MTSYRHLEIGKVTSSDCSTIPYLFLSKNSNGWYGILVSKHILLRIEKSSSRLLLEYIGYSFPP